MPDGIYIIDVFSLLFQVYHAIPPMTGPSGQPTNAVFGFTRDIINILRDKQPSHIICAMDSEGPGERNDWYDAYKANRTEMPADLVPQIPMLEEVVRAFEIPLVSFAGWEADDVIATLTRQAEAAGLQVSIVSSDKDCRQLLSPAVRMFNCRKNEFFDEDNLMETWGIRADQVIDFQSLVGDSIDNVPGVPLVGPKKATALLEKFGTLDDVLANADDAPGKKLSENLKTYADQARISKKLVTLRTDLPLDFDLQLARVDSIDILRLQELFQEYGFRRFKDDVVALNLGEVTDESNATVSSAPNQKERAWHLVDDEEKFGKFLAELKGQTAFCFDLETTSLNAVQAEIVGWAICWEPGIAWYLPVDGPGGQQTLKGQLVLEELKPLLEDPEIVLHNQNIKYDALVLQSHGVQIQGIGVDPMVGHYLLDAGARGHGLDALAQEYLNHKMIPISELIGKGKQQKKMFEVDIDKAGEYASEDADIAFQLAGIIEQELQNENLWELYWDLERPLISVLTDMEFQGIKVDAEELHSQSDELASRLSTVIEEIYDIAGHEFNIDSPKQLREILFEELNLPVQKRTKTGPSTDQSVLEKLAAMHPLPERIILHRQLSKLKSTYLDSLPTLIHPKTGRIHASFNQVVAATGRLSSSDPNLQNIPIRTEEGRRVRKAFVAGKQDCSLICADYSQIELRVLADFSKDEALIEAFQTGKDIHTAVAAEIFNVDEETVDKDMRRVAKAVNFGVVYGQSPFGLAAALNIPQEDAAAFIDGYFGRYPGVSTFIEQTLEECKRTGYAYTILGRRRPITGIKNTTGRNRNMAERTAINTVIQGSAADLIKKAMINVHNRLAAESHLGKLLLQIHDELVLESPDDAVESLITIVREEMEQAMTLTVPLVVDVSVGKNWLETTPVE